MNSAFDSDCDLKALVKSQQPNAADNLRRVSVRPQHGHVLSSPYEMSTVPIECQESVLAVSRQMTEKCKLESNTAAQFVQDANQCVDQKRASSFAMPIYLPDEFINYQRVAVSGEEMSGVPIEDLRQASTELIKALKIREKYIRRANMRSLETVSRFLRGDHRNENWSNENVRKRTDWPDIDYHPPEEMLERRPFDFDVPGSAGYHVVSNKGIVEVRQTVDGDVIDDLRAAYTSYDEFIGDYLDLAAMITDGPLKSFCHRRLSYLYAKFQLHILMNDLREMAEQKSVPHRDFYNSRKVDTHVHAASSMNQKHLLRFMKKKVRTVGERVVCINDGQPYTLNQVFDMLHIKPYDLNVDTLDVHADRNTFHRFDKFNSKYNPLGQSILRDIFIKTDNYIEGEFFAEVLKEVMFDLTESKYQHAEYRLSIYGRSRDEWDKLAAWAIKNDVHSHHVRWIIQIPRLYDIYQSKDTFGSFQDMLDNVFVPLFEATNDPSSHPNLHRFLRYVVGLDSVDDESKVELYQIDRRTITADQWNDTENPPYAYYLYYMYANLAVLNQFRKMRGFNCLSLRPHCGEAGPVNHLIIGFMACESISHGLLLRKVPVLQYLYYLCQVGIAMSPLSNNGLFLAYHRNPLPEYLAKGLNISLSTDDPLQFHFTKEPLMEEFSIAAQVWKLSNADMCEIARNSVLQSGFPHEMKLHWLGRNYEEPGVAGNDVARTNVPDIRVSYRHETLVSELCTIFNAHMSFENEKANATSKDEMIKHTSPAVESFDKAVLFH